MGHFIKTWTFWFLMALKQLDKSTKAVHDMDDINFCPEGDKQDMDYFRIVLKKSKHVIIITGAGLSAPSGIPTFRGQGGMWRKYKAEDVATTRALKKCPSDVWEYFHYFRELIKTKEPNPGHRAIAEFQNRMIKEGKNVTLVTQNIDGLHQKAGSPRVLEYHGNVFETKCLKCKKIEINMNSPICPALKGRENFTKNKDIPEPIPTEDLPRCGECQGLLRPNAVFFGEDIPAHLINETHAALKTCDLCLVIGTSSQVYPTGAYGPKLAGKGVKVAEFNIETTQFTNNFRFFFNESCVLSLPKALAPLDY